MKYNLRNFCEFDKHAVKSYCAIHGTDEALNLGDITEIDENKLPDFNVICGGSPCQDFSISGNLAGSVWQCRDCNNAYNPLTVHYEKRSACPTCGSEALDKTRSSLLVEWLRIIRGAKPDWGIYENVKNIVGKKFKNTTFRLFEKELHEYGYHTYWTVLNAKHYGIPQNRERVYLILIKKELDNGQFKFPEPLGIYTTLSEVLEEEADEKYYLSQEKVHKLITDMGERKALLFEPDQNALKGFENKLRLAGNIAGENQYAQTGRVYFPEGCCPALTACGGGGQQPKIISVGRIGKGFTSGQVYSPLGIIGTHMAGHHQAQIIEKAVGAIRGRYKDGKTVQCLETDGGMRSCHSLTTVTKDNVILVRQKTKKGYEECVKGGVARISYPKTLKRGRVQAHGAISPTLLTSCDICRLESLIRIRRLTPLECFRLMGFSDEDFRRTKEAGVSDSQLYKQTGNAIVVDVLFHIFLELYKAMPYLFEDVQLSSFFSGIGAFEKAFKRLEKEVNQ